MEGIGSAEFLAESLHPPGGIYKLLLAREKRMTRRANIDRNFRQRRSGLKRIAAGTVNRAGLVSGMDLRFHRGGIVAAEHAHGKAGILTLKFADFDRKRRVKSISPPAYRVACAHRALETPSGNAGI